MLQDCRQHYIRKLAIQQEQARYISNAEVVEDAYDDADMHAVPNLAITCRFGETEALPFGDASIRFYRAGHILGASSVLIEDQSGRRIFFSGDFSSFPQLTVPAASWPEDLGEIDLLVLESTYGSREHHKPLEDSRSDLVSFIRQTLETREGSVILASFGLGRAQELLKMLVTARQDGLLPSVPIHVDGMIKQINPIYRKHADFVVPADAFNEVSGETERSEIAHRAQREPSIIVTTSGMLTGGPVVEYARRLLPDARNRIVLTGYQDEGAPTRTLRELTHPGGGPRVVEITDQSGESVKFEAAMPAKEIGLSAHADRAGLIDYAKRSRPATIALVHGEPAAQEELRFRLSQTHGRAEIVSAPTELEVP
jgi:Cft2 family RNA processing exonuclease